MSTQLLCEGLGFAEAPRWRDRFLWISDIAAREVVCLDEAGNTVVRLPTPGRPSGLGWLPDQSLLAVMMDERLVMRYADGKWVVHADLSRFSHAPMNDMAVSASGAAYVTGFGYLGQDERRPTNVILVRADWSAEPQPYPVWRPNGCLISRAGASLIVAEARLHRLTRFRIDAADGLNDPERFAVLPRGTWADGICLDAEDCVWVADPKGGFCRRVSPTGKVLFELDTSPLPCVACALGGHDGRTLFLLLSELGDFEELNTRRQARIATMRVDVPGVGSP